MGSWVVFLWDEADSGARLSMALLRQIAMHAGASKPRSYLQGGNLVFEADPGAIDGVLETLGTGILERISPTARWVSLSANELRQAAESCPFEDTSRDGSEVRVGFLAEAPDPKKAAALEAERGEDRFEILDKRVYVIPAGAKGGARLGDAWFLAQLGTAGTFKTWNTVQQLLRMAPADDPGPGLGGRVSVVLTVADLAASLAFYRDGLGLALTADSPNGAELRAGSLRLQLEVGKPPKKPGAGLHFEVADLATTRAALAKRELASDVQVDEQGASYATLTDPDGRVVRLS